MTSSLTSHPLVSRPLLLLIITAVIAAAGIAFYGWNTHQQPTDDKLATSIITTATPTKKTAQQWLDETIECAALLANHESAEHGSMSEKTANLVSYALGKAQEYAVQVGLDKTQVKLLYDKKTLAYFMDYSADAPHHIALNHNKAALCETTLQTYEPDAQIRNSINKAKQQIQSTTEKPTQ